MRANFAHEPWRRCKSVGRSKSDPIPKAKLRNLSLTSIISTNGVCPLYAKLFNNVDSVIVFFYVAD